MCSELYLNWNDNSVAMFAGSGNSTAIFEAVLEDQSQSIAIVFVFTVANRADKNNQKGLALVLNLALNYKIF